MALYHNRLKTCSSQLAVVSWQLNLDLKKCLLKVIYCVVILSIDPSTVNDQELRLLEKESNEIVPTHKAALNESLLEVLKLIYLKNTLGTKPTYNIIGTGLEISKPTVRKRIKSLISTGYVSGVKTGNRKVLELTEKGRNLFLK